MGGPSARADGHGPAEADRAAGAGTRPRAAAAQIRCCGVCRTDLHLAEGDLPPKHPDMTPGHEVVAEVVATGPGRTRFQVGDRVGAAWLGGTEQYVKWPCRSSTWFIGLAAGRFPYCSAALQPEVKLHRRIGGAPDTPAKCALPRESRELSCSRRLWTVLAWKSSGTEGICGRK